MTDRERSARDFWQSYDEKQQNIDKEITDSVLAWFAILICSVLVGYGVTWLWYSFVLPLRPIPITELDTTFATMMGILSSLFTGVGLLLWYSIEKNGWLGMPGM